jgi:hypothetical protein
MIAARSFAGSLRAVAAIAALGAVLVASAFAEDSSQPRQIVVRVSRDAVTPLADMQIDTTTPVEDVILGTYVRGKARTTGQPAVEFVANPNQATFAVLLKGATVSRTVGRNGPATIYTRADTHFTATTQVRFEPGRGFVAERAKIAATTRATNEGIGTRRGLVGWIVHRRACGVAGSQTGEAIARQPSGGSPPRSTVPPGWRLNEMTDVSQRSPGARKRGDKVPLADDAPPGMPGTAHAGPDLLPATTPG